MAKSEAQSASKAAADGKAPNQDKAEGTGGSAAPRPRKWNYGIVPEHKVAVVPLAEGKEEPKLKAQEAEGYEMAKKGCTVEAFLNGSTRGVLRRLSRKGYINVIGTDGTKYPTDYVAPAKPAPKDKPKADSGAVDTTGKKGQSGKAAA